MDRWLALEIHSDEEFAILMKIIGQPELSADPRFSDMNSRKNNEEELDQIIGDWICRRDRDWMVNEFCKAGLIAAPSRNGRDLYADRHLRDRQAFKIDGIEIPAIRAPLLGEHNEYVLSELLGLNDNEIADLRDKDIIMSHDRGNRPLER